MKRKTFFKKTAYGHLKQKQKTM